LQTYPSISTGKIISGFMGSGGGLKLEWTKVSSRSKAKVFLPFEWGF